MRRSTRPRPCAGVGRPAALARLDSEGRQRDRRGAPRVARESGSSRASSHEQGSHSLLRRPSGPRLSANGAPVERPRATIRPMRTLPLAVSTTLVATALAAASAGAISAHASGSVAESTSPAKYSLADHAHLRARTALRPPASHGYASRRARGGTRHPSLDRAPTGPSRRRTCPAQAPPDQQTMDCVTAPTRGEFCASLGSDLRRHRGRSDAGAEGRSPTPPPRAGTRIRPVTVRGRTPRAQAPRARLHRRRSRAISDGAIALVD